jgi:antitoxin YefM
MTKVLSISEFRSNLAVELEHLGNDKRNQIIIKRPKGKSNIVVLSQEAYNAIEETVYLLSSKKNREHILKGIKELNSGKGKKIKLEDIWK